MRSQHKRDPRLREPEVEKPLEQQPIVPRGRGAVRAMKTVNLEGLHVHRLTMNEAVEACIHLLSQERAALVVTPNTDHLVRWLRDAQFREAYASAELIVADGTPLVWLSRLQGPECRLPERVTGVDLVWQLCREVAGSARLFVLGSDEQSAEMACRRLHQEFGLETVGHMSPQLSGTEVQNWDLETIRKALADARADIILLAFGSPKQELLYAALAPSLDKGLFIACGAAVEFFAGTRVRAPRWMQNGGLEWLFRLMQEPSRLWRRYLLTDMAVVPILIKRTLQWPRLRPRKSLKG